MTTQAKERPILFKGEMVRAIIDGRKTVTRRVIAPNKRWADEIHMEEDSLGERIPWNGANDSILDPDSCEHPIPCPYGVPGDRLWVKEAHYLFGFWQRHWKHQKSKFGWEFIRESGGPVYDFADLPLMPRKPPTKGALDGSFLEGHWYKRSPLFMEKKDARTFLEVVSVGVEKIQSITKKDAFAEGVVQINKHFIMDPEWLKRPVKYNSGHEEEEVIYNDESYWGNDNPVGAFASYIDEINGPETWSQNMWVWRVEFKKL